MKYLSEQKGESKMSTNLTTTTKKKHTTSSQAFISICCTFKSTWSLPQDGSILKKESSWDASPKKFDDTACATASVGPQTRYLSRVWCLDIWWNSTKKFSFLHLSTLPTSPLPVAVTKWRKEQRTTPALSVYTGCKSQMGWNKHAKCRTVALAERCWAGTAH